MTTSAVSMSVLEKYSSINRDIELARNQRALLESETEAVQEQMRELAEQRGTLETETVQANQEASVFHSRVDAAAAEYTRVEQEHTQAFLAKDRAVQEQTCLQQCVAETRQGFLEQSREFRSNCKRMRLRASSLGLDHASIRAFSIVNDMDGFIYDQLDHPPALAEEEDTEDGDPADWVAEDDDEEMQGFLLLYRQEQQAFEIATQHFEKCRARKETEMHKASSRKDRKDKLQAQVDKIQKVNSDLEAEIQEQESLAQEIKLMRDNYAKSESQLFAIYGAVIVVIAGMGRSGVRSFIHKEDFILTILCSTEASHRKLQITQHKSKVTPSPLSRSNQASSQSLRPSNTTRNPYARSSNSSKTATGSQLSSNSDTELQTAVLGRPAAATIVHSPAMSTAATNTTTPSLLERQHPHRTGRIRRDRQFGSTLEITGASRSWHETVDSFPEEIGADDTPTPQTSTSTFDQVVQALEDDDDDEDEALLSYTAFSK
jgi:predicted  nucleic acid-binding Zn-ribbon protein